MSGLLELFNALNQMQDKYGYRNMADRVYDQRTGQFNGVAGLLGMPGQDVASQMSAVNQAGRDARAAGGGLLDVNAARDAAGAMDVAGALNFLGNIKAYHGSPHSFDRFDMSKIGTGEGAQAYGHGLYFAESPQTAEYYKTGLSGDAWSIDGKSYRGSTASNTAGVGEYAASALDRFKGDVNKAIEWLKGGGPTDVAAAKLLKKAKVVEPYPGSLYEVNIKAKPEDFLDWDKPLSEQPENVRRIAERIAPEQAFFKPLRKKSPEEIVGRDVWEAMRSPGALRALGKPPDGWSSDAPSKAFLESGVPGIKYLDQGSRSAGQGSSNYVVFDDKLIEILKKYGIAGLGLTGLLGAAGGKEDGGL